MYQLSKFATSIGDTAGYCVPIDHIAMQVAERVLPNQLNHEGIPAGCGSSEV